VRRGVGTVQQGCVDGNLFSGSPGKMWIVNNYDPVSLGVLRSSESHPCIDLCSCVFAVPYSCPSHDPLPSLFDKLKLPLSPSHPTPTAHHVATMGSIVLPHLRSAWHVDQAILSEEERLVVIRFGRDHDRDCKSPQSCPPRPKKRRLTHPFAIQASNKMNSSTRSPSA
jgi:hypothetical protein